jgi:hypothetical protein
MCLRCRLIVVDTASIHSIAEEARVSVSCQLRRESTRSSFVSVVMYGPERSGAASSQPRTCSRSSGLLPKAFYIAASKFWDCSSYITCSSIVGWRDSAGSAGPASTASFGSGTSPAKCRPIRLSISIIVCTYPLKYLCISSMNVNRSSDFSENSFKFVSNVVFIAYDYYYIVSSSLGSTNVSNWDFTSEFSVCLTVNE